MDRRLKSKKLRNKTKPNDNEHCKIRDKKQSIHIDHGDYGTGIGCQYHFKHASFRRSGNEIKQIKTSIFDGVAVLFVEYTFQSDVDDKYQELVREIGALRPSLPENIYSIDINKVDPSNVNVIQLALISENAPRPLLKKQAD